MRIDRDQAVELFTRWMNTASPVSASCSSGTIVSSMSACLIESISISRLQLTAGPCGIDLDFTDDMEFNLFYPPDSPSLMSIDYKLNSAIVATVEILFAAGGGCIIAKINMQPRTESTLIS